MPPITETRRIHKEYPLAFPIAAAGFFVFIGILIGGAIFPGNSGYDVNIYTEVISILITVGIIEQLNRHRDKTNYKRDLIRRLGSQVPGEGIRAVEELRATPWLKDGSLKGVHLFQAKLQGADLYSANLQGARLFEANLQRANLIGVYLPNADLRRTNLRHANLLYAYLVGARLLAANLQHANLERTNLQGTDLSYANLRDAILTNATFDENTTLPDGTKWTLDTDLSRFTDSSHPNFWRSDNPLWPCSNNYWDRLVNK